MGEARDIRRGLVPPFLRWAGSKRQLLPLLATYSNCSNTRYVEPFAGSAALFFYLAPRRALLADINKELISAYRQVKSRPRAVAAELAGTRRGRHSYNRLRAVNPTTLSGPQRAARFIFLNRFCFNGLYRTNRAGQFNVPYGGDRTGNPPSSAHLFACSTLLKRASLLTSTFHETLDEAVSGDFVYLDPPFRVSHQRIFTEYSPDQFSPKLVRILRDRLLRLDRNNIPFLLSYAQSEEADLLRKGFHSVVVSVRRNIAGFAARRKSATEILISNCPPRGFPHSP